LIHVLYSSLPAARIITRGLISCYSAGNASLSFLLTKSMSSISPACAW
jgi:hypothetical protein